VENFSNFTSILIYATLNNIMNFRGLRIANYSVNIKVCFASLLTHWWVILGQ